MRVESNTDCVYGGGGHSEDRVREVGEQGQLQPMHQRKILNLCKVTRREWEMGKV